MADGIAIPHQRLSPEILRALIEEYVLREGTDYGTHEYTLAEKTAHVMRQLESGEAQIYFDPADESCNIVSVGGAAR